MKSFSNINISRNKIANRFQQNLVPTFEILRVIGDDLNNKYFNINVSTF